MAAPKKVFCSHRSVDKPDVKAFAAKLRERGVDAWYDDWEIQPGDNVVEKINQALDSCEVGLVFFSKKPWPGKWFTAEHTALVHDQIEKGRRVIPVMIDADADLPALLRPRARRGIEDFEQIVDAISGVERRPPLGRAPEPARVVPFILDLTRQPSRAVDLAARLDDATVATEANVPLTRALQQSYAEFLSGHSGLASRGPAEAARASLDEALRALGAELGRALFPSKSARRSPRPSTGSGPARPSTCASGRPTQGCSPFRSRRRASPAVRYLPFGAASQFAAWWRAPSGCRGARRPAR